MTISISNVSTSSFTVTPSKEFIIENNPYVEVSVTNTNNKKYKVLVFIKKVWVERCFLKSF